MSTCQNVKLDAASSCDQRATHTVTWPGHKEPTPLCADHLIKLSKVAIVSLLEVKELPGTKPDEPTAKAVDAALGAPVDDVVRDKEREKLRAPK